MRLATVLLLPILGFARTLGAEVLTGIDSDAQLPFWEFRTSGMSVRLVQRLPDQTRAFFRGRGFSKSDAELIAQNCIFQTIYKNTAAAGNPLIIDYDLTQWVVLQNKHASHLKVREEWQRIWSQHTVSSAAQIALNWSLLPTRQTYHANDYNWGMTSFGLPPGSEFDLSIQWRENGVAKSAHIEKLQCAPDIKPE